MRPVTGFISPEKPPVTGFTSLEKRAMLGLSAVLGARMLGFSLVLPMFSNHAIHTLGATQAQAGVAFGIYGVSQAALQIPFGMLSDRYGRKAMVATGLVIFVVGSVVAALSTSIVGLTIGYFLQGASAIASAILAWVTDSIDVARRNVGMAVLGMSIGVSIVLGLPLSPILADRFGGAAIFWVCGGLSMFALFVVLFFLQEPHQRVPRESVPDGESVLALIHDRKLLVLNAAGFLVYFAMRAVFFVVPLRLAALAVPPGPLYMEAGLFGAILMGIGSRQSDKGRAPIFISASLILTLIGYLLLGYTGGHNGTVSGFGIWFAGFSVLQALLPGAVSKLARAEARGTTLGLFNTSQYVGTALGGVAAGTLSTSGLYGFLSVLTVTVILFCAIALRHIDAPVAGLSRTAQTSEAARDFSISQSTSGTD